MSPFPGKKAVMTDRSFPSLLFQSMPIMRHFCLFTALGILMLYLLSITFFLACLVLDEHRIDRRQVCPCAAPKTKAWKPGRISRMDYGKWVFENVVSKVLLNNAVKAGVLLRLAFYSSTLVKKSDSSQVKLQLNQAESRKM